LLQPLIIRQDPVDSHLGAIIDPYVLVT
jgi:hypothetical protein